MLVNGKIDVGCNSDVHEAFRNADMIVDNFVSYGFDKFERPRVSKELYVRKENAIHQELEKYYHEVKKIMLENRKLLDKIANELYEKKMLLYTDIDRIKATI